MRVRGLLLSLFLRLYGHPGKYDRLLVVVVVVVDYW